MLAVSISTYVIHTAKSANVINLNRIIDHDRIRSFAVNVSQPQQLTDCIPLSSVRDCRWPGADVNLCATYYPTSFKSSKMDESIVTHQLLALRCQECCVVDWIKISPWFGLLLASNSNFPSLLLTPILPPSSLSYILSTLQIIGCYAINMPIEHALRIIQLYHIFSTLLSVLFFQWSWSRAPGFRDLETTILVILAWPHEMKCTLPLQLTLIAFVFPHEKTARGCVIQLIHCPTWSFYPWDLNNYLSERVVQLIQVDVHDEVGSSIYSLRCPLFNYFMQHRRRGRG